LVGGGGPTPGKLTYFPESLGKEARAKRGVRYKIVQNPNGQGDKKGPCLRKKARIGTGVADSQTKVMGENLGAPWLVVIWEKRDGGPAEKGGAKGKGGAGNGADNGEISRRKKRGTSANVTLFFLKKNVR